MFSNFRAKNRRPPEVATSPDVEKEAVTLTGSMPQPARPLRSAHSLLLLEQSCWLETFSCVIHFIPHIPTQGIKNTESVGATLSMQSLVSKHWFSILSTFRSSMERIRIPPDEAASEDYAPRRDSYSTDEDSYTPNSSQHQDYRQDDPDMQPHDHYGSAV